MGAFNWKGNLTLTLNQHGLLSSLSDGWKLFQIQLPYDYLTPLQAAVGVVQKVIFHSSN